MALRVDVQRSGATTHLAASVLVVDDDPDIREMLGMLLEFEGYVVRLAEHGQAALDDLHANPRPCCIVLDLQMPIMDGRAFRAAQQQDAALADIPVIVVTASYDVAAVAALHAAAYLKKPFTSEQLLPLLRQVCP
jgi:CheY-like chemotaxis protein